MYRTALTCGLLILLAAPIAAADPPAPANPAAEALQRALKDAIRNTKPSIACIIVSRSDSYKHFNALPSADQPGRLGNFDGDRLWKEAHDRNERTREALIARLNLADPKLVPESFGGGVVIDDSGLILTNFHIVRDATKVYVRLAGGKGSYADIHAGDPCSDLAVLKLLTPPAGLKSLPLGRGDEVEQGDFVVGLTYPYVAGYRENEPSAFPGTVSKVKVREPQDSKNNEQRWSRVYQICPLIESTTRLNAGCSGGSLVNFKGELIGLYNSLATVDSPDAPEALAVPIGRNVQRIIEVLKSGKEVEYGFLGVSYKPGLPGPVLIDTVTTGSPAANVRLPAGQHIVKVDGVRIGSKNDLAFAISTALAGQQVKVEMAPNPNDNPRAYTVTLAKYYLSEPFIASERPAAVGGLRVDYASTMIRSGTVLGVEIPAGVVVREVVPGSPAAKANIPTDAVITHVNGEAIFTPADYYEKVSKSTGPFEVKIKRLNSEETVKLERK